MISRFRGSCNRECQFVYTVGCGIDIQVVSEPNHCTVFSTLEAHETGTVYHHTEADWRVEQDSADRSQPAIPCLRLPYHRRRS